MPLVSPWKVTILSTHSRSWLTECITIIYHVCHCLDVTATAGIDCERCWCVCRLICMGFMWRRLCKSLSSTCWPWAGWAVRVGCCYRCVFYCVWLTLLTVDASPSISCGFTKLGLRAWFWDAQRLAGAKRILLDWILLMKIPLFATSNNMLVCCCSFVVKFVCV